MQTAPTASKKLTRKGQQTRSHIVAVAARLMAERGVAGTTLEHVREAASVSSSQIYNLFRDKDALVLAVIGYQEEAVVGVHEAMFAQLDSLAGLRAWRDFVVGLQRGAQCRGGCPVGSLAAELAETDSQARADVSASFVRWAAALHHSYQRMASRGVLASSADPEQLAYATLAALQGGLLLAQVHRTTAPLEAALDTVLAHVATLIDG